MLHILLHQVNGNGSKIIQASADTPLWVIFRMVRSEHPGYCFYESWLGSDERGSGRVAA